MSLSEDLGALEKQVKSVLWATDALKQKEVDEAQTEVDELEKELENVEYVMHTVLGRLHVLTPCLSQ